MKMYGYEESDRLFDSRQKEKKEMIEKLNAKCRSNTNKKEWNHGLCYRCEHRAIFHETGMQPRCECGSGKSVHSCYMFRPVVPLVLVQSNKKDKRPFLGPAMISSRACSIGTAEGKYVCVKQGKGYIPYWKPKGEK